MSVLKIPVWDGWSRCDENAGILLQWKLNVELYSILQAFAIH